MAVIVLTKGLTHCLLRTCNNGKVTGNLDKTEALNTQFQLVFTNEDVKWVSPFTGLDCQTGILDWTTVMYCINNQ